MKHLAVLCSLLFAGCVMDAEEGGDQTGAAEQTELQINPSPSPSLPSYPIAIMFEATESVTYRAGDVTDATIWPLNRGIHSVEVLSYAGPMRGRSSTVLTFVVWNGNFVSHIYIATTGSVENSLRAIVADTVATRVTVGTDYSAIISGSGTGGTPIPLPHPNVVGGEITFSSTFLNEIKSQANIEIATATPGIPTIPPIYEPGY